MKMEFLGNYVKYIIYVQDLPISTVVQQKLLRLGFRWLHSGLKVINNYEGYICVHENKTLTWNNNRAWDNPSVEYPTYQRVTAAEFLGKDSNEFNDMNKTEGTTMELKEISKENLNEAKKKVTQDRMNAEVEYAMKEYRRLTDQIDSLTREMNERATKIAELRTLLKPFN